MYQRQYDGYGAGEFWRYTARGRGLGFMVAAAAPVAAATGPLAPFTFAAMALASALPFVGQIGAGRRDADAIVPTQEELGRTLGEVDRILSSYTLTASDLRQLDSQLRGIWQNYLEFIYQDALTSDGDTRASDQSRAAMEPQVMGRLQTIANMLGQVLGPVQPAQMLQAGGPASLQFRQSSNLTLPQAGFMTPGSWAPQYTPATTPAPSTFDSGLLMKLAVAGVVAALVMKR